MNWPYASAGGVDAAIDIACHHTFLYLLLAALLFLAFARQSLPFPAVPSRLSLSSVFPSLLYVVENQKSNKKTSLLLSRGEGRRPSRSVNAADLSDRDWAILTHTGRLRYITGSQIERLHFTGHTPRGRAVVRSRVLARLVDHTLLSPFARRIGGMRGGSGGTIYTLNTAGQRLLHQRTGTTNARVRKPWPHLPHAIDHALLVSELYVRLIETSRNTAGAVRLAEFVIEPACWWRDGRGGTLKPDAYLVLHTKTTAFHWW
ncbi:MAG: replication-relaxation family protein, partial [Mycobacteriales bacterium]